MENGQKKSYKTRIILLFILGTIFGISIGMLGTVLSFRYYGIADLQIPVDTSTALNNIKTNIKDSFSSSDKYSGLDEIWSILKANYYYDDKLNFDTAMENAKKGLIDSIGDPFSTYFNKKEASEFAQDLQGTDNFEGIGAVVSKKTDGVQIEEIIKGSPAFKAGLRPLDMIVQVSGEDLKDIPLSDIVSKKLRGVKGSTVEITVYRDSEKKAFKITLVRDTITIPSVSGKVLSLTGDKNIGYIEISKFGEDTEKLMENTINELKGNNLNGIILDLRGNGGGIVTIAVDIASHFIPKDKIVVETRYRSLPGEKLKSEGLGEYEGKPVVILVDGMTASASEIIGLALKEQIGAKLLGTKTFGKGSIQTIYNFKDGSSFKYTVGRWYAPNGETIDKVGIQPDINVPYDATGYQNNNIDNQLESAKTEVLKMIK